jgi:serine/threonine-protein kinase
MIGLALGPTGERWAGPTREGRGVSSWVVPGYSDGRELGRGPAGRTVLARHTATGAPAVIRYLPGDDHGRARHRDLARRLVGIRSPHVAQLYEYVETDGGIALVREYVIGVSLGVLEARGTMKPEPALTVLKGGLLGLSAGHAAGVAHGAYNPANVLIDGAGRVAVSDFGLAAMIARPEPEPEPEPESEAAADRAAAVAVFVANLAGGRADRLPRRLRGLPARLAAAGEALGDGAEPGAAMVAEVEAAARTAYGADWEARGRERLGRLAARHAGRATRRGRPDR